MMNSLLALVRDPRVAFLIVGGLNTVIGFVFYIALLDLASVPYAAALPAAYLAATVVAFVLHRRFVFRVRGHAARDLFRFLLVNLGALAVNEVLLTLAVREVGLNPVVGQLVAAALTMMISFIGHRNFSFRRPRHTEGQQPT